MEKGGVHRFDLCGGHIVLDFTNTLSQRHTAAPREHLTDYRALTAFFEQSAAVGAPSSASGQPRAVLRDSDSRRLEAWSTAHPLLARRITAAAIELREALHRLLAAIVEGRAPAAEDFEILNAWVHRTSLAWRTVGADEVERVTWGWTAGADAPDAFFAVLVRAAVDLLTSPDLAKVKVCEADDCVWLFFDSSKNQSRRWCDMAQCGNRMKARRFYERASEARADVPIRAASPPEERSRKKPKKA